MSKKIPTIGKVWIIAMIVIQFIGAISSIVAGFTNPVYIIPAILEIGAVVSLVMMLIGKGLPYFISYCACYGVGAIVSQLASWNNTAPAYVVGFIFGFIVGLAVNFSLTYLSAKNTFSKEEK